MLTHVSIIRSKGSYHHSYFSRLATKYQTIDLINKLVTVNYIIANFTSWATGERTRKNEEDPWGRKDYNGHGRTSPSCLPHFPSPSLAATPPGEMIRGRPSSEVWTQRVRKSPITALSLFAASWHAAPTLVWGYSQCQHTQEVFNEMTWRRVWDKGVFDSQKVTVFEPCKGLFLY